MQQQCLTHELEAALAKASPDTELAGIYRQVLDEMAAQAATPAAMVEFTSPVVTVSDVMAAAGLHVVDLLKVDVEGDELEALKGVAASDWEKIRQVVVEVSYNLFLRRRPRTTPYRCHISDRFWVVVGFGV